MNTNYWGKGLATELLGELVKYIFDNGSYRSINAYITQNNKASMKVAEKNLFKNQGLVSNENFDEEVYLYQRRK